MKKTITISILFFICINLTNQSLSGEFSDLCLDYNIFYQEYAELLQDQSLDKFFENLPKKQIQTPPEKTEPYKMAEIEFPDKSSFLIKKILLEEIDPKILEIFHIFQESKYIPNILVCTEYLGFIYIFTEKLYKNFSEEDGREEFLKKPLPERLTTYIEISRAIKDLHKKQIVHNDITPKNIMSSNSEFSEIKLIDFQFSSKTHEECKGGTPLTNSPEKNWGKMKSELDVDIYAFGMTIAWIEIGIHNLAKIGILNFFNNYELENHLEIINFIKENLKRRNLYRVETPPKIVKFWHYFKSFFYANHMERIYTFEDLLAKMMDFEPVNRPSVKEVYKKMKEFKGKLIGEEIGVRRDVRGSTVRDRIEDFLVGKFGLEEMDVVKGDVEELLREEDQIGGGRRVIV